MAAAQRVLFACTWNATRSPMAAALLAELGGARFAPASAGVHGGRPVDPLAVAAMAELGVDIGAHRPHSLSDLEAAGGDLGAFDLIVALSEPAREEAQAVARFAPVQVEHWPIEDPTRVDASEAERLAAYRRVRDRLAELVRRRFSDPAAA